MNLPKKLKIGAFEWSVEASDDISREGNCYGSTHPSSQKIFIDPTTTEQHVKEVLLHEIMHAVWWQMGLGIAFKDQKDFEERVITSMAHGLHQVLSENNDIFV